MVFVVIYEAHIKYNNFKLIVVKVVNNIVKDVTKKYLFISNNIHP